MIIIIVIIAEGLGSGGEEAARQGEPQPILNSSHLLKHPSKDLSAVLTKLLNALHIAV